MATYILDAWFQANCGVGDRYMDHLLYIFYLSHSAIFVGMCTLSVAFRDVYLALTSLGLSLSYLLNWLGALLALSPAPLPGCGLLNLYCVDPAGAYDDVCGTACDALGSPPGCLPCIACGWPALELQQITYIVIAVMLIRYQWRVIFVSWFMIGGLLFWFLATAYMHVGFHLATPGQVLGTVLLAALLAVGWQSLIFFWMYPWSVRCIDYYGIDYFRPSGICRPVLHPGDPVRYLIKDRSSPEDAGGHVGSASTKW